MVAEVSVLLHCKFAILLGRPQGPKTGPSRPLERCCEPTASVARTPCSDRRDHTISYTCGCREVTQAAWQARVVKRLTAAAEGTTAEAVRRPTCHSALVSPV